jgi:hypothetical protein
MYRYFKKVTINRSIRHILSAEFMRHPCTRFSTFNEVRYIIHPRKISVSVILQLIQISADFLAVCNLTAPNRLRMIESIYHVEEPIIEHRVTAVMQAVVTTEVMICPQYRKRCKI